MITLLSRGRWLAATTPWCKCCAKPAPSPKLRVRNQLHSTRAWNPHRKKTKDAAVESGEFSLLAHGQSNKISVGHLLMPDEAWCKPTHGIRHREIVRPKLVLGMFQIESQESQCFLR